MWSRLKAATIHERVDFAHVMIRCQLPAASCHSVLTSAVLADCYVHNRFRKLTTQRMYAMCRDSVE